MVERGDMSKEYIVQMTRRELAGSYIRGSSVLGTVKTSYYVGFTDLIELRVSSMIYS